MFSGLLMRIGHEAIIRMYYVGIAAVVYSQNNEQKTSASEPYSKTKNRSKDVEWLSECGVDIVCYHITLMIDDGWVYV